MPDIIRLLTAGETISATRLSQHQLLLRGNTFTKKYCFLDMRFHDFRHGTHYRHNDSIAKLANPLSEPIQ